MLKIELRNIDKTFVTKRQTTHALVDINIAVPTHSIVSIVGPSGCGKSTIIRIINDIIKPSSGAILIDGKDYGAEMPKEIIRKMGFIFQRPNLLPWLTLRQNIAFPQKIVGQKGQECEEYVERLLAIGRLQEYAEQYPTSLSGGTLQRGGVMRAMANKPEILLMDEPFGSLDDMLREKLDLETLDIWEKLGQTIIFITHNVREAVLMASKVYVMATHPGRIVSEIPIDLPYPRKLEMLATPKFMDYETKITSLIGEIELSEIV